MTERTEEGAERWRGVANRRRRDDRCRHTASAQRGRVLGLRPGDDRLRRHGAWRGLRRALQAACHRADGGRRRRALDAGSRSLRDRTPVARGLFTRLHPTAGHLGRGGPERARNCVLGHHRQRDRPTALQPPRRPREGGDPRLHIHLPGARGRRVRVPRSRSRRRKSRPLPQPGLHSAQVRPACELLGPRPETAVGSNRGSRQALRGARPRCGRRFR